MMTTKESYKDRQENELEVLKSIFGDDVVDLRKKEEKWMPLDLTIKLKPQRDSKISQAYCHIELHVICPKNYPKVCPKLSLENAKGLANSDVVTLLNQINKEAYGLKGEVMIFEICQFIQSFLHERNVPPKGSFYDEMLATKQKRDQDELTQQKEIEEKKRQHIQDEILKRKEQLRKENRIRKGTTDSPLHHISSESSNSDSKFVNEICDEHNCSENLYFPNDGRKILKGTCIGHSMKGCINFSGIDLTSGRLFYITEWTIKYSLLESKNLKADEVIENIEKMMACLIKLRHKYLVAYDSVSCTKRKDSIMVILLQEFLYGISICNMSTIWNWSAECTSNIAKCVLEALVFLHNNGVSHGNLLDTSVFIDATGNIKVSDYSIVTYLQELTTGVQASLSDLYSLGSFIESLMPTPHFEMKSFINECKSERTLSASDLLEHPFLYTALINHDNSQSPHDNKIVSYPQPVAQNFTTPYCIPPLISSNNSRLETEFEIINYIGRGAYGDVLKCRNILDNRQYAIKRVPLSSNNKQIFKKMTREVELLSRLNHENVVRYFNSWIEIQSTKIPALLGSDDEYSEKSRKKSSIIKTHSHNRLTIPDYSDEEDDNDSLGLGWNTFSDDSSNEDSDDGIEFVDSRGNAVQYESDDDCISDEKEKGGKGSSGKKEKEIVLYIQMEYCEKSTLRLAIDANLYLDKERYWKLFREIVEGLYHIHQQGMIHRDLKCENIFLDSRDHIKIADFGLATTNVLALQNRIVEANQSLKANQISYGDSHTGQVGTALYVAPELSGKASRSTYNQKVDVFSLGIIFFEMITPPLKTGMERITTILKLRQPDIILPKYLEEDDNYKNEKQILKWLLNHNPSSRPTSEELLQSELMPPVKMEANELQDMLRHVLANPQSRSYKHLINKMMLQECDDVIQFCYHQQVLLQSPSVFENVKSKIEEVFRKHGAIDIQTPLLTPYTKSDPEYITRLMTHSGLIVTLPHDLNTLFLRYVAANGINLLRRYSIGRVYRERKLFNSHPKQNYEVEFNVVTPNRGNFLVDAELCVVAHEIISEFDVLKQKNLSFAINHTSLLRAIFLYYSVPTSKYKNILALTADYLEGRIKTKYQLQTSITSLIPAVKSISSLIDTLLITDIPITNIASTNLKVLVRGRGEAAALAKGALRELETVINLSQAMGVTTPINLYVSLSLNQDCSRTGSIVWQLLGDGPKPGKQIVFAHGGRYDSIIEDYKKLMQKGASLISREIYCAGFTFAIEKLVTSLNQLSNAITYRSTVDLLFYVTGTRPPLKEICHLLKSFWNAGHKCCYIESPNNQVDEDVARDLGANHILVLGEDGCLRIKTWQIDRYDENTVSKAEALNYLKKNLSMDINTLSIEQNFSTRNNSLTNIPIENINAGLPFFEINFITNEKITSNKKKRLVNQIEQKLSSVMKRFSKRETFVIFVVELDAHQIRSLISCIDPDPKQQSQNDFDVLQKMLPKNKQKYIQEVYDEITDKIAQNKNIIVGMFGIQDSYYRIIL